MGLGIKISALFLCYVEMMGKATKKATKPQKLKKEDYFGYLKEKRDIENSR